MICPTMSVFVQIHDNMGMLLGSLRKVSKSIPVSVHDLVEAVVCERSKKTCMLNQCLNAKR